MKKIIAFSYCFCLFLSLSLAQSLTSKSRISVLGISRYTEQAIGQVVKIQFIEDPNKCDPRKGNMTLEQQVDYFGQILTQQNIDFTQFKPSEETWDTRFRQKVFEFFSSTAAEINKVKTICANLDVKVIETYFKMPKHRFETEDSKAVEALKDATRRAQIIARKLGNKKVRLLNIDDDTSNAEVASLLEKYEGDPLYDDMLKLIEVLAAPPPNPEKSAQPTQQKGYSILATFEIE